MSFDMLYIFVEGDDDERFFQEILIPKFRKKYKYIRIIKYAQKPKKFEYVKKFIKSIKSIGAEYIYVTDIDNSPCITAKKQEIVRSLKIIDIDRILIVVKEIESWYLAGLSRDNAKKLGIKIISRITDGITKEQFENLIPKKFDSHINFMREVLKNFSIEIARQRNKSLDYCIRKYGDSI